MKVWIVTVGEPLPIDGDGNRLHRGGMIADAVTKRGHQVLWWTSTLDHIRKEHRYKQPTTVRVSDGLVLRLLHGVRYSKNISVGRMWNHRQIGRQFYREAASLPKPDVILSSFPTIELSERSAEIGRETGVPVLLDVRDLWPDIFVQYLPKAAQRSARLALRPLVSTTKRAFRNCTGIIGTSEEYLQFGLSYAGRERRAQDGVFPLGYSRPENRPAALEDVAAGLKQAGVDPQKTICWFVGSFGATYDLAPAIEAARRIERTHKDVQFVFSGDGDRFTEWSSQAAGLRNVVFTGWLNADGLAYLSSVAKIGLAAYGAGAPQSLPNKIFEYLSAGLPIVTSLGGECKALLAAYNCGNIYAPGDTASLLGALTPYLENEAYRSQRGANAARLFQGSFRSEEIYPRLVDFLEDAARGRSRTTAVEAKAAQAIALDKSFLMFKRKSDELEFGDVSLPAGLGLEAHIWRPRLLQMFPPFPVHGLGEERMLSWQALAFFYLYAMRRGSGSNYRIAIATDQSRTVRGFAVVRGADFRFPFMPPGDVQFGPVWTAADCRGLGLAAKLCRTALRELTGPPRNVLWLCRQDNEASKAVALKLGLSLEGMVERKPLFGFPAPHIYRLPRMSGDARREKK